MKQSEGVQLRTLIPRDLAAAFNRALAQEHVRTGERHSKQDLIRHWIEQYVERQRVKS